MVNYGHEESQGGNRTASKTFLTNLLSKISFVRQEKKFGFFCIADKLRMCHDEALMQQEVDEKQKRAALHTDLTQYWSTHQRVEDSKDADLKCGLKGAFRITIPENELGPASMQIFQVGSAGHGCVSKTSKVDSSQKLQK